MGVDSVGFVSAGRHHDTAMDSSVVFYDLLSDKNLTLCHDEVLQKLYCK
jgi:hypothetical protein